MVPDINLLPKRVRRSSDSRFPFMIAGIVFVLILSFFVFQYVSLRVSIHNLEAEQEVLRERKASLEVEVESLDEVDEADLETAVLFIEKLSYPVSPLFTEINRYITENAYLREYAFSETEIQFSVDFETMTDVVQYVGDLEESTYFNDVKVDEISRFDPIESEEEERVPAFDGVQRFTNHFTVTIDPSYILLGRDAR